MLTIICIGDEEYRQAFIARFRELILLKVTSVTLGVTAGAGGRSYMNFLKVRTVGRISRRDKPAGV